ncbi:LexA family transcriptional regulator [Nitrosospira sp. Nsp13]|uniref:LexA family protein n=1 Tax=Nitrosospira sp. Nsp13 TaxID=1855332 RepID=UPI00087EBE54|nr:translesion error-prone DNA polymerase V autoproteolytic subunit [Nitrosospira sp. Nsp13]SCX88934.1 SOS response UmuD protein. Serine peptidase. MEROPS family S24 [Nitrosospira sp. Nsp13]
MGTRGGRREGSGPKKSMGPYGEKTALVRVPMSRKAEVLVYLEPFRRARQECSNDKPELPQAMPNPPPLPRPIYSGKISAGQSRFPSPAQDYEQKTLDLNDRFIANPPATFFFTVKGDSMVGAGIFDGATLIVDRALKPKSSSIVIADVDGEWMVKRLYKRNGVLKLLSENPNNAPIVLKEGQELVIFGVVTYVINEAK